MHPHCRRGPQRPPAPTLGIHCPERERGTHVPLHSKEEMEPHHAQDLGSIGYRGIGLTLAEAVFEAWRLEGDHVPPLYVLHLLEQLEEEMKKEDVEQL